MIRAFVIQHPHHQGIVRFLGRYGVDLANLPNLPDPGRRTLREDSVHDEQVVHFKMRGMMPVLTLLVKNIQRNGNIEKIDREYRYLRRRVLCYVSPIRYRGGYPESGWYYAHGPYSSPEEREAGLFRRPPTRLRTSQRVPKSMIR